MVLDKQPAALGMEAAIVFFNDAETFTYARPDERIDARSGVICCPNNFEGHGDLEGMLRITSLANFDRWMGLDDRAYEAAKRSFLDHAVSRAQRLAPGVGDHLIASDTFTPKTILRFTGHISGAVYGSPRKRRDGVTPWKNLFICGTDQGFLGIIGSMLSGITIANLHVLGKT